MSAIAYGYYYGHNLSQNRWELGQKGGPLCTKTIPVRYCGYPDDSAAGSDPEDRLIGSNLSPHRSP